LAKTNHRVHVAVFCVEESIGTLLFDNRLQIETKKSKFMAQQKKFMAQQKLAISKYCRSFSIHRFFHQLFEILLMVLYVARSLNHFGGELQFLGRTGNFA